MIRLLGAIVGSALAIAVLIVLVGVPERAPTRNVVPEPVVRQPEPATIAPEPRPIADEPVAAEAKTLQPEVDTVSAEPSVPAAVTEPLPGPRAEAGALRWHAFWSPFRSRIAANGFVEQLQRVTGLDYRVVNIKPGVYEVAFAYTEDADVAANLAQISAATGLDVPGS